MRVRCGKMFCHQVIHVHLQLQCLVIHILAGCQHYGRVDFQGDIVRAAGNQHHTHGLGTPAAFSQLRLIAFRAVAHGNQCPGLIKQAHFTYPPTALVFRDHLFSNNLAAVLRVDIEHIQRSPTFLIYQCCLLCVRRWQCSAAIADRHMGNF